MTQNDTGNPLFLFLREKALAMGFIAIGASRPERPLFFRQFCDWISSGKHGELHWMENHLDLRADPKRLLEGCRTVISLAYPYASKKPATSDGFTVARYAEPQKADYHDRLRKMGRELAGMLKDQDSASETRVCVDSAPVLERSFAYASGIGFIGKNNTLILPGYGSYLFLVEILTTTYLPQSANEPIADQCGSCNRCLISCPTGALEAPFSLNVNRCLSYLTIEYPGEIPDSVGPEMGTCFLGCDICQEVCPHNSQPSITDTILPSTKEILSMEKQRFLAQWGKTALKRPGLNRLKRNIRRITGASLS